MTDTASTSNQAGSEAPATEQYSAGASADPTTTASAASASGESSAPPEVVAAIDPQARSGISRLSSDLSDARQAVSGLSSSVSSLATRVQTVEQHIGDNALDGVQSSLTTIQLKLNELEAKLNVAFEKLEHHGIGVLAAIKEKFEEGKELVEEGAAAVTSAL